MFFGTVFIKILGSNHNSGDESPVSFLTAPLGWSMVVATIVGNQQQLSGGETIYQPSKYRRSSSYDQKMVTYSLFIMMEDISTVTCLPVTLLASEAMLSTLNISPWMV